MITMINELMDLASTRALQQGIQKKSVDLNFLARRLKRTFQNDAARKGLSFRADIPKDFPQVVGDQELLEQMLENLISNAIKYTLEGSVDVLFTKTNHGTIRIEVRDTGIGIREEDFQKIFADFFRTKTAKSIEEIGTGLGLAIAHEIADKHKGTIKVESKEGRGTTFIVTLPIGRTGDQP